MGQARHGRKGGVQSRATDQNITRYKDERTFTSVSSEEEMDWLRTHIHFWSIPGSNWAIMEAEVVKPQRTDLSRGFWSQLADKAASATRTVPA
ncbi:hypothetical protein JCM11641_001639 [Rhodosporidiobolus odoratus]